MPKLDVFTGSLDEIDIDLGTASITDSELTRFIFDIDTDTAFTINGRPVQAGELVVGSNVTASYLDLDTGKPTYMLAAVVVEPSDVPTELELKGRLYRWFAFLLPTLWSGTAGTRPENTIEFVWGWQGSNRPAAPFMTGRLSDEDSIGRDELRATGSDGTRLIAGQREFRCYLQTFGPGALDTLKTIRNACGDPVLLAPLQAEGLALRDRENIVNLSAYLDTSTEPRAALELRFAYAETWTSAPGVIEHVNLNGMIDDQPIIPEITI